MRTKNCRACKEDKKLSLFRKVKKAKDGLSSWCKACHVIATRASDDTKKQEKWEARYMSGDEKISLCFCGNYFEAIFFTGTSFNPCKRSACKRCLVKKNP